MLEQDAKLRVSNNEYLSKSYNLLIERFSDDLDLKSCKLLKCIATQRKTVYEFHDFILGAKETTKYGIASVHYKLMEYHKPFVIYFDREDAFIWFDWFVIKKAGFANKRIDGNVEIPMWNFRIDRGVELRAHIENEVQQDFWWNK